MFAYIQGDQKANIFNEISEIVQHFVSFVCYRIFTRLTHRREQHSRKISTFVLMKEDVVGDTEEVGGAHPLTLFGKNYAARRWDDLRISSDTERDEFRNTSRKLVVSADTYL